MSFFSLLIQISSLSTPQFSFFLVSPRIFLPSYPSSSSPLLLLFLVLSLISSPWSFFLLFLLPLSVSLFPFLSLLLFSLCRPVTLCVCSPFVGFFFSLNSCSFCCFFFIQLPKWWVTTRHHNQSIRPKYCTPVYSHCSFFLLSFSLHQDELLSRSLFATSRSWINLAALRFPSLFSLVCCSLFIPRCTASPLFQYLSHLCAKLLLNGPLHLEPFFVSSLLRIPLLLLSSFFLSRCILLNIPTDTILLQTSFCSYDHAVIHRNKFSHASLPLRVCACEETLDHVLIDGLLILFSAVASSFSWSWSVLECCHGSCWLPLIDVQFSLLFVCASVVLASHLRRIAIVSSISLLLVSPLLSLLGSDFMWLCSVFLTRSFGWFFILDGPPAFSQSSLSWDSSVFPVFQFLLGFVCLIRFCIALHHLFYRFVLPSILSKSFSFALLIFLSLPVLFVSLVMSLSLKLPCSHRRHLLVSRLSFLHNRSSPLLIRRVWFSQNTKNISLHRHFSRRWKGRRDVLAAVPTRGRCSAEREGEGDVAVLFRLIKRRTHPHNSLCALCPSYFLFSSSPSLSALPPSVPARLLPFRHWPRCFVASSPR